MGLGGPNKMKAFLMAGLSLLAVSVTAVSTFAWFQINNSVSPASTGLTNSVSTDAIVHQNAAHPNDDRYATSPVTDSAGTLSYDHSRGGDAVDYYLKIYGSSGGSLANTYQMFSNMSDSSDLACYFNVNLSAGQAFKVYSAGGTWYGYQSFTTSISSAFSDSGEQLHDIVVVTAGAYDVFLREDTKIWVVPHTDTTTSVAQGDKTGYYICGTPSDANSALLGHTNPATGIPMYVNAAKNTSDLAFYAGLRLSAGDSFSVVKDAGDSIVYYAAQTAYYWNGTERKSTGSLLNDTGFFAKDSSGAAVITNKTYNENSTDYHHLDVNQNTGRTAGAPTTTFVCRQTGYYNIALAVNQTNSDNPDAEGRDADIHVGAWDGKDVLGTRYTTSGRAPGTGNRTTGIVPKTMAANGTENVIKIYFKDEWTNNDDRYNNNWFSRGSNAAPKLIVSSVSYDNSANYSNAYDLASALNSINSNYSASASSNTVLWMYMNCIHNSRLYEYEVIFPWAVSGFTFKIEKSTNSGWNSGDRTVSNTQGADCYLNDQGNWYVDTGKTYSQTKYTGTVSYINPNDSSTVFADTVRKYQKYTPLSVSSSSVDDSGYSDPTGWYTDSACTDAASTSAFLVTDDVTYYGNYKAILNPSSAPSKTRYYFDIYWAVHGSGSSNHAWGTGLKVYAWSGSNGNEAYAVNYTYTATAITSGVASGYTGSWYYCDIADTATHIIIYHGNQSLTTPYQSENISIPDGTNNSNLWIVTGFSNNVYTGSFCANGASNGTVQTISIYKSFDRNGTITDNNSASATYQTLNNETWRCSAITSVLTTESGFTTPTLVHKDSNNGETTYNSSSTFAVTSNVALYGVYTRIEYTFRLCQSANVGGGGYAPISGAEITYHHELQSTEQTFFGVHLEQGKVWYIDDNMSGSFVGTILWAGLDLTDDSINISVSGIDANTIADQTHYFEEQSNNIRTKVGGTYDVKVDCSTKKIVQIDLISVDYTDFVIRGNGAAFGNGDFTEAEQFSCGNSSALTASGTYIDFAYGQKTFYIGDQCKSYRPHGSATSNSNWSATITGTSNLFVDPFTGNVRSGGHLTANVSTRLDVTTGVFSVHFDNQTETSHNSVSFNHAEDAGIYIETTTTLKNGSPNWDVSTMTLMHATSATYNFSGTKTYQAQESPFQTTSGMYMRIIKTHSNNSNNTPTTTDQIREYTETRYYKTVTDMSASGFTEESGYITVTASNNWTISLRKDGDHDNNRGEIEITRFTGNESIGVEHTVPYWLVGTGKPGSDLRNSDFTIANGQRLYTYGSNSESLPAYVGSTGGDGCSSAPYGSGIYLKKGDQFAISTSSNKVTAFAGNTTSGTGWESSNGIVAITESGRYRIWLTDDSGAKINVAQVNKDGMADIDQDGGADVVGYEKEYGVKKVGGTTNGTINFGGNLDYSLLDAYKNEGYTFVVELNSSYATSLRGTLAYQVTNSNTGEAGYSIKARAKTAAYAANAFSNETYSTINKGGSTAADFHAVSLTNSGTVTVLIEITIPVDAIKTALSADRTLAFAMTISCTFTETIS